MTGTTLETNTKNLLFEWGRWARTDKIRLEARGTLGKQTGSTVGGVYIMDSDAEKIDRLVAKLLMRDHEMGTAIKLYYLYNFSYRKIEKRLNLNKEKVRQLVLSGESWIDAGLVFNSSEITSKRA